MYSIGRRKGGGFGLTNWHFLLYHIKRPKDHEWESSEMVPKDHQQLQSMLVKLGLLKVQTRSCCVQWSGFSTLGMSLLYDVLRGFVSGCSRQRTKEVLLEYEFWG